MKKKTGVVVAVALALAIYYGWKYYKKAAAPAQPAPQTPNPNAPPNSIQWTATLPLEIQPIPESSATIDTTYQME